MESMMKKMMAKLSDPKVFFRGLLENLSPMELNIKFHGIRKDKEGTERLWISIVMPKIELPDIPDVEETEKKKEEQ